MDQRKNTRFNKDAVFEMRQRTKTEWLELIEAQAESGQTAAAFCRDHGVDAKYFSTRRKTLLDELGSSPSPFSAVALPAITSHSEIRLETCSGVVLKLPSSVDPIWLASLLRELSD